MKSIKVTNSELSLIIDAVYLNISDLKDSINQEDCQETVEIFKEEIEALNRLLTKLID